MFVVIKHAVLFQPANRPASQVGSVCCPDQDGISNWLKSSGCAARYLVRAQCGLSHHVTLMSPSHQTPWVTISPPGISLSLSLSLSLPSLQDTQFIDFRQWEEREWWKKVLLNFPNPGAEDLRSPLIRDKWEGLPRCGTSNVCVGSTGAPDKLISWLCQIDCSHSWWFYFITKIQSFFHF